MTSAQRMVLPDTLRTNGATTNPWWDNAVVYQIYPRSFQDSNGDGIGDIPGITSRLDYLAELGVDVMWLSPVYKSPQDDNGYDISDYQAIDPVFGTLADMDELLAQAHARGIKVVMDLVVNHTSDEHKWFQASRNKASQYSDWYWWRPARPGFEPGTPGAEPNAWGSYFGGSAWEYDAQRGEYFFHQFSKKQPDLNWENSAVRAAVFTMMNWWMDRGVDGFRMDVISLISKKIDAQGKLPGEPGSAIPDGPIGPEGYSNPALFSSDGPRLDEFLAAMRRAVFEGRDGFLTVGEAPGINADRDCFITDPANGELDMLFVFDHMDIGHGPDSKWDVVDWNATDFKQTLGAQQEAVRYEGWASLFLDNHDQPRAVSRFGDDSTEELRVLSAKALALLLHLHRGTPYIYQGEELGMTNAGFSQLSQYRDVESINHYHQRVEKVHLVSSEKMLDSLSKVSRDNARTPMQWDSTKYAGFMPSHVKNAPWIGVNPNKNIINAEFEMGDAASVYAFYRRLIELRHNDAAVAAGEWGLLDIEDPTIYSFTRRLQGGMSSEGAVIEDEELLVVVNLSSNTMAMPAQTAELVNGLERIEIGNIVLSNYRDEETAATLVSGTLEPWEALVYRLK